MTRTRFDLDSAFVSSLELACDAKGETPADTKVLRGMAGAAKAYVSGHDWCPPVKEVYVAFAVPKVVGVFLVEFAELLDSKYHYIWVVEGDLPSAYMVTDKIRSAASVLEVYCELMEDWISAVNGTKLLEDAFPVSAKPTKANADGLLRRVAFLRKRVIPLAKQTGAKARVTVTGNK